MAQKHIDQILAAFNVGTNPGEEFHIEDIGAPIQSIAVLIPEEYNLDSDDNYCCFTGIPEHREGSSVFKYDDSWWVLCTMNMCGRSTFCGFKFVR